MSEFAELHPELRSVAKGLLADGGDAERTWQRIVEVGWIGLEVPEEFGGAGASFAETAVVLEEMGRAVSDAAFFGTAVLGVGAALATAPSPERDDLLVSMAAGSTRVAVALAPDGDAALAVAPFTIASGVVHGRAEAVVDAWTADTLLLLADAGDRLVLVRVDADRMGVAETPVLDESRSLAQVVADGVAVVDADVWSFVGDPSDAAQALLDRAAVALAVDAIGAAWAMLDATVDYVGVRRQFDRPIGSFQAVKHQCADALVALRVGRELVDLAVAAVATGSAERPVAAASAKAYVGAAAVDVVGVAMQLHGGIGYTWESGVHGALKRALLDRALVGSPAEQRRRIADRLRVGAP